MTAQLTYQIIQTLPETERTLLFDMLESDKKPFSIDDLINSKEVVIPSDNEMICYLIENCFSKIKDS